MPKLKEFGYEELKDMTPEQLLKTYNTLGERINKRITKAGGRKAVVTPYVTIIRSPGRIKSFLKRAADYSKGGDREKIIKDIYQLLSPERSVPVRPDDKYFKEFKDEVKRTIRQTFLAHELSGDYKGEWVDRLSAAELQEYATRIEKIKSYDLETPGGSQNAFWYMYQKAHIVGGAVNPITSREMFDEALRTAEAVYKKETALDQMTQDQRAAAVSEGVKRGRY